MSQEQLSEKADISAKHLSTIERGLTFVSADLLEKFACLLEIPVFCLFVNEQEVFYNEKGVFYSDAELSKINMIVEKHLAGAIEEIKADIRRNQS